VNFSCNVSGAVFVLMVLLLALAVIWIPRLVAYLGSS
jgi:hypothetical protein